MPQTTPTESVEKEVKASMSGPKVYLPAEFREETVEVTNAETGDSVTKDTGINMNGAHVHVPDEWLGDDVEVEPVAA